MPIRIRSKKPAGPGCLFLIALLLLVLTGVAGYFFLQQNRKYNEVKAWPAVPCHVQRFDVRHLPASGTTANQFQADVSYTWQIDGKKYTGTQWRPDGNEESDVNRLEEIAAGHRAHPDTECHVKPDDPAVAALDPPDGTLRLILLGVTALAGCFALFALGTFLRRLIRGAQVPGTGGGCFGPALFCLLFAGAGLTVMKVALLDRPDLKNSSANWEPVNGEVIRSFVHESRKTNKGHTSYTYRPDILFRYESGGRTWMSNWYDLSANSTSSSGRPEKEDIVRQYPAGKSVTVWVNAQAPWQAVIERSGGSRWWIWLIVIVFTAIGVLGFLGTLLGWIRRRV